MTENFNNLPRFVKAELNRQAILDHLNAASEGTLRTIHLMFKKLGREMTKQTIAVTLLHMEADGEIKREAGGIGYRARPCLKILPLVAKTKPAKGYDGDARPSFTPTQPAPPPASPKPRLFGGL